MFSLKTVGKTAATIAVMEGPCAVKALKIMATKSKKAKCRMPRCNETDTSKMHYRGAAWVCKSQNTCCGLRKIKKAQHIKEQKDGWVECHDKLMADGKYKDLATEHKITMAWKKEFGTDQDRDAWRKSERYVPGAELKNAFTAFRFDRDEEVKPSVREEEFLRKMTNILYAPESNTNSKSLLESEAEIMQKFVIQSRCWQDSELKPCNFHRDVYRLLPRPSDAEEKFEAVVEKEKEEGKDSLKENEVLHADAYGGIRVLRYHHDLSASDKSKQLPLSPLKWALEMEGHWQHKLAKMYEPVNKAKNWPSPWLSGFYNPLGNPFGSNNVDCNYLLENAVLVKDNHTLFLPNRIFHSGTSVGYNAGNAKRMGKIDHVALSFSKSVRDRVIHDDSEMATKTKVVDSKGNRVFLKTQTYYQLIAQRSEYEAQMKSDDVHIFCLCIFLDTAGMDSEIYIEEVLDFIRRYRPEWARQMSDDYLNHLMSPAQALPICIGGQN